MYLDHFGLKEVPFSLSPNTQYFCNLPGHQEAFNVIMFSLRSGESLIKVTGEVGSGKTLMCRRLINALLNEQYVIAYIPNPDLSSSGIRIALALELGLEVSESVPDHFVLELITDKLIDLHQEGKRVVLLIDEAQSLPDESLEAIRLMTNLETESEKLLQIVLFGQPELDVRLGSYKFRQLKQRISFACRISAISPRDLEGYLSHRLMVAGHACGGNLFTKKARSMLYEHSQGIPRVINTLSHKAMLVSYGQGRKEVDHKAVKAAIQDNDSITEPAVVSSYRGGIVTLGLSGVLVLLFFVYAYFNQFF
jgi:MSHA biogenesis protein MshM